MGDLVHVLHKSCRTFGIGVDMTTSSFLMAFRRFISCRGTPTRMISDNGKQFKLASSTIDSIWKTIDKCDDVLNYSWN